MSGRNAPTRTDADVPAVPLWLADDIRERVAAHAFAFVAERPATLDAGSAIWLYWRGTVEKLAVAVGTSLCVAAMLHPDEDETA